MTRRHLLLAMLGAVLAAALPFSPAIAHHGWAWTTGGQVEVTGVIKTAKLGNPHGILELDVEGETWEVEVGQPWRNHRVDLMDEDLVPGVELRIVGEPSADINDKRVKAIRVYIGDKEHILYSDRD